MTIAKRSKLPVIDTISIGYHILNQRIWVLIIPIAMNLYIWHGTRLSLAPFFTHLHNELGVLASVFTPDPLQQEQIVIHVQNADMRMPLAVANFVPVLPDSLLHNTPQIYDHVLYIRGPVGVALSFLAINILALLVSSMFLTILTTGVQSNRATHTRVPTRTQARVALNTAVRIALCLLAIAGIFTFLFIPLLTILLALFVALPNLSTPLIIMPWFVAWFLVYLYTGFSIEAILINRTGPIKAIASSITLVRNHFLSTIGFLIVSYGILRGLSIVWQILANNLVGQVLAIIGSAYIGSGLVAARLVYYQNRLNP